MCPLRAFKRGCVRDRASGGSGARAEAQPSMAVTRPSVPDIPRPPATALVSTRPASACPDLLTLSVYFELCLRASIFKQYVVCSQDWNANQTIMVNQVGRTSALPERPLKWRTRSPPRPWAKPRRGGHSSYRLGQPRGRPAAGPFFISSVYDNLSSAGKKNEQTTRGD